MSDWISVSEWISVKDRLPENNQKIKGKSNNLWVAEGIFQDNKFVYGWIKGACFGDLTHWMPVPKQPDIKDDWIRVKDYLPPNYHYVLVYGSGEPFPISIARYEVDRWVLLVEGENNAIACGDLTWSIEADEITHWTNIPKKPEDNERVDKC